jgi:hypothetical protein
MRTDSKVISFQKWLEENSNISESTAKKYYGAITGAISNWAIDNNIIHDSLLAIDDVDIFLHIQEQILQIPIFIKRNTVGNHMYSCALDKFYEYLYEVQNAKNSL